MPARGIWSRNPRANRDNAAMTRKYCEKCGVWQEAFNSYCSACGGSSFKYEQKANLACVRCGNTVNPDDGSCIYCETLERGNSATSSISREVGFRVSTVTYKTESFPITTSNYVPGQEIVSSVGLVFSSGTRRMAITQSNLASNTYTDALKDIQLKALAMGADAVISLQVSIEHGGTNALNYNQTVTLIGTAVKLKR